MDAKPIHPDFLSLLKFMDYGLICLFIDIRQFILDIYLNKFFRLRSLQLKHLINKAAITSALQNPPVALRPATPFLQI